MSLTMDSYSTFIHKSRYARWLDTENRRENWDETINRYLDHFGPHIDKLPEGTRERLYGAIHSTDVMPSMRALMSAGRALEKDNVAGFNCAYLTCDHPRAFDEMCYILMCGTGVGFSVERQYINKLPEVAEEFHVSDTTIAVMDSKIGWAKSFKQLLAMLWAGEVPKWDTSRVREAGARLKVFGGRASGPEPLEDLFAYTVNLFRNAAGRKLTSYECHLLCCKIADIVVVGGVRRSALIGLSNLSDDRIRRAKHGNWYDKNPELALANNSTCYTEKPDFESYMDEWASLYKSKSGERGLFSRIACQKKAAENGRRDAVHFFGCNPCSEIILRPNQFCNLSEIVVRAGDTFKELREKAEVAAILGTLQATQVDFRYLRPVWRKNTEEECLLGVSLTGVMDNQVMSGVLDGKHGFSAKGFKQKHLKDILTDLRDIVVFENKCTAKKLGINQATATTCIKPSGTVSQLVDSASGIHKRYAPFYIRRVRNDKKDPISDLLIAQGVPHEEDKMNPATMIFSFPKRAPEGSVVEGQGTSLEFLKLIDTYNKYWCEHKVSATVHYKDDEFLGIGQYLWDTFDTMSGVSLLPYDGHTYQQAPYEKISEETYEAMKSQEIEVDWSQLVNFESTDTTTGTQELACSGAKGCEI